MCMYTVHVMTSQYKSVSYHVSGFQMIDRRPRPTAPGPGCPGCRATNLKAQGTPARHPPAGSPPPDAPCPADSLPTTPLHAPVGQAYSGPERKPGEAVGAERGPAAAAGRGAGRRRPHPEAPPRPSPAVSDLGADSEAPTAPADGPCCAGRVAHRGEVPCAARPASQSRHPRAGSSCLNDDSDM